MNWLFPISIDVSDRHDRSVFYGQYSELTKFAWYAYQSNRHPLNDAKPVRFMKNQLRRHVVNIFVT